MKCASIDIGTNTILLLVGEVGHDMREIVDIATITRLGEGLHENGYLLDVPMARSLEVMNLPAAELRGIRGIRPYNWPPHPALSREGRGNIVTPQQATGNR